MYAWELLLIHIWGCVASAVFHGEDGPVRGENDVVYGDSAGGNIDDVVVLQRSSSEEP